jgi:hypothetical protein
VRGCPFTDPTVDRAPRRVKATISLNEACAEKSTQPPCAGHPGACRPSPAGLVSKRRVSTVTLDNPVKASTAREAAGIGACQQVAATPAMQTDRMTTARPVGLPPKSADVRIRLWPTPDPERR